MNKLNDFIDLNKYQIQQQIGKGSFGNVFKVIEKESGTIYAAKISSYIIDDDNDLILNLEREVDINSRLDHPSIMKFIGYSPTNYQDEPYPVIITEFIPNGTLAHCIYSERKSLALKGWNDTKKLINIYGIASAMSYLHSHNIIHRDLKPSNILEDDSLFPKISDFGLSKTIHQNNDSITGQSAIGVKGTPIYISPEIWEDCEYTKPGDVYAFGIIVYELITLSEPFKGSRPISISLKVTSEGFRPKYPFPVPKCYKDLINQCVSFNPEDRPTFEEIVQDLKNNSDFITDTVDEAEFHDYVDYIENSEKAFSTKKKFASITFSDSSQKVSIDEKEPSEASLKTDSKSNSTSDSDEDEDIDVDNLPKDDPNFEPSNSIIKQDAFHNDQIYKYIEIPSFITQIGMSAFENSKLVRIDIPSSVSKIGNFCFKNCSSLRIVNIASSVTQIGMNSFENCTKLKCITLPSSLVKITANLFSGCIKLKEITIPNKVNEIGMNSFLKCKLKEILIPSSVTKIMNSSFELNSRLTKVEISSSVQQIGNLAFKGCTNLKEVKFGLNASKLTQIGRYCFGDCPFIEQITIPSSVKQIGGYVFSNCSALKKILIPSSVNQIGEFAFSKCSSLIEVVFNNPSSLVKLEKNTFANCKLLTKIEVPASVTKIENNCFENCHSLVSLEFQNSSKLVNIEHYVIAGCDSLNKIKLPPSLKFISDAAFVSEKLKQLLVPSSIKKLINEEIYSQQGTELQYFD